MCVISVFVLVVSKLRGVILYFYVDGDGQRYSLEVKKKKKNS